MRTLTRHGPALQYRAIGMVLCLPCKTWFSLTGDIFQRGAFRNYSNKTSKRKRFLCGLVCTQKRNSDFHFQ